VTVELIADKDEPLRRVLVKVSSALRSS
jgi:hypothetical protein